MGNNILNYTGLDYDTIRRQVEDFLNRDPRFENMRDSAVAKTLLDVFAAMTDLNNYYIERRAEEQYFETAKLRSSIIMLARNLGYVPTRPIPAEAGVSITLRGDFASAGVVADETVTFQKHITSFTGEGFPFVLKNSYTYTFTNDDISESSGDPTWEKTISHAVLLSSTSDDIPLDADGDVDAQSLLDIEILQGEFKTHTILGTTNNQVGLLFQQYNLNDTTFSNYYGEEDVAYNAVTETVSLDENLTKLAIGTSASVLDDENNLYTIKRRTLAEPNLTITSTTIPKTVLIRTNMDEGIDISFGDDRFASKGAANANDNIYLKYFSTLGATANKVGVIGNALTTSNGEFTTSDSSTNISSMVTFNFSRNIKTGSDMEEQESISLNAPQIYSSLDRLVNKKDYITYLKTQVIGTSGTKIKNAIAWGEQEEILERNQNANFRFYNTSFFTCLAPIYSFPIGGTNTYLDGNNIHEAYLEQSDDFSTVTETSAGVVSADGYPEQSYFNIFVKENPQSEVSRVEDYRVLQADHPILDMYDRLESRGQTTIRHIYLSPIVQTFTLDGSVTIGKLENRTEVQKRINNAIYTWLNEQADFNVNIHKSNITDIIQNNTEVKNSNVYFSPVVPDKLITTWADDPDYDQGGDLLTSAGAKAGLSALYDTQIQNFISSAGNANIDDLISAGSLEISARTTSDLSGTSASGIWTPPSSWGLTNWTFKDVANFVAGNVTERSFYTELMKNIYDDLGTSYAMPDDGEFRESQYFKNIMYKMHNDLSEAIKVGMIDSNGNITRYSLKNEIVQIQINLSYQFES